MWVSEIAGCGYFGVGVGGAPPPELFWQKLLFFTYFTWFWHSTTEKSWGSVPSSLPGALRATD